MVEKTGHKTTVLNRRRDWIAEERRKELGVSIEEADLGEVADDSRAADAAETTKEKTPAPVDVGDEDDDIYTATPRRAPQPADQVDDGPDDDELEALMMEADDDIQQGNNGGQQGNNNARNNTIQEAEPDADEEEAMAGIEDLW